MENNDNNQVLDDLNTAGENQKTDNFEENSENSSEKVPETNYEEKIKDLNEKYLRLYSEFDNYRKRTIKEKSDIIKSAGEDVFKAFLPVIDDFERAIKANENVNDIEALKEGIKLIYHKLSHICTSKGLEAMESIGKPFDSDLMEAITHIPATSDDMKGKVIDDIEKGYKLGDKVIRFAKVVVAQ